MGVSVRLSKNARVYLPFWIAIPAYLIIGMVWLMVAVGWALAWITIQCCQLAGQAIAQRRARARQAIPVVSSDHPPGPPRIEHTDMTDRPSPGWQPPLPVSSTVRIDTQLCETV